MAKTATTLAGWRATHRHARISPRKARLVIDLIRGRKVADAESVLRFSGKKAGGLIAKVLKSAIANANEAEADLRALRVVDARIDPGPYFRRWRPKDRGRAHAILKRTSHITVVVQER